MAKTLLKNGTIVTASHSFIGELLIEDGSIAAIGPTVPSGAETVIDCTDKLIMPGMVDTHVHFREPGLTHKGDIDSETRAAVAGGVTTICDMPNTVPQTVSLAAVKEKQALYQSKSFCNFGIYIGATKTNLDELKKADEDVTIPAIKIFMAESTGEMTLAEDTFLEPIFRETSKLIATHAEDEPRRLQRLEQFADQATDPYTHALVRDNQTALLGTQHAIRLATAHHHRTHILHMSTKEEIPVLQEAATSGLVTGETCPHYLLFNREDIKAEAGYRIMNPSLKGKDDSDALFEALRSGVITQIATDHAPHTPEEKELPYGKLAAGLPGVQFALPLLLQFVHEGKLTLNQVVALYAENPAKNYRLRNKGKLEKGFDADIVIIDRKRQSIISNDQVVSKCGWTPYAGMALQGGLVTCTIVNGKIVYDKGTFGVPGGISISVHAEHALV